MKTAIIYTFSGTRNTLTVANNLKTELAKHGIIADIFEISKPYLNIKQPSDYDIVGFGYPIHAFNCPKVVVDFISLISKSSDKYTFVFKTSGEPFKQNNASSYLLSKELLKKGLSINLEMHILMPYNIMFRYKDNLVKQMLKYMHGMTKVLACKVLSGETNIQKYNLYHLINSFIFRIQWGGAVLNGHLYKVKKSRCTNCNLCINTCPTKNIYRDEKSNDIKFNGRCAMCMRCAMTCPVNAINIGILSLWKVNGSYKFDKIMNDDSLKNNYVNKNTFGYFRLFYPYFKKCDELFDKYNIKI